MDPFLVALTARTSRATLLYSASGVDCHRDGDGVRLEWQGRTYRYFVVGVDPAELRELPKDRESAGIVDGPSVSDPTKINKDSAPVIDAGAGGADGVAFHAPSVPDPQEDEAGSASFKAASSSAVPRPKRILEPLLERGWTTWT